MFDFATAHRIVFGPGTAVQLPGLVREQGHRPLLVTGRRGAPLRLEAMAEVQIAGEPTFEVVRDVLATARRFRCDVVIGVGGGSVLDAAKALAMLLGNEGDPLDYAEVIGRGRPILRPSVPLLAVPTTAGTGSEVTRNAVLCSREHRVKVSLRSPHMLPKVALVDPALALELPRAVTAATGMDALSQLIEPFVCNRANPMTDAVCREGLRRAASALPRAVRNGEDLPARTDLAFAALCSGMALANAGLGAVHGFAAPLGGRFEAPHGAVCAALLAPVMEANLAALRALGHTDGVGRYAEVAQLITGRPGATPDEGVEWVRRLTAGLEIPPLRTYGVEAGHVPDLVRLATQASSMKANPVALTERQLTQILEAAL